MEVYDQPKLLPIAIVLGLNCNYEKMKYEARGLEIDGRLVHIKVISCYKIDIYSSRSKQIFNCLFHGLQILVFFGQE